MNFNPSNLVLKFQLEDDYYNKYNIKMEFYGNLFITATNVTCFPKKVYKGSFNLNALKERYKFFRIYDSTFEEAYDDLKSLMKQDAFVIKILYNNVISLCIKKQIGFQNDIIFPLNEENVNINEVVFELCDKYLKLEKKVSYLEQKVDILFLSKKEPIKSYKEINLKNSTYTPTKTMNGYGFANKKK